MPAALLFFVAFGCLWIPSVYNIVCIKFSLMYITQEIEKDFKIRLEKENMYCYQGICHGINLELENELTQKY